jgi:hypothetical protein
MLAPVARLAATARFRTCSALLPFISLKHELRTPRPDADRRNRINGRTYALININFTPLSAGFNVHVVRRCARVEFREPP